MQRRARHVEPVDHAEEGQQVLGLHPDLRHPLAAEVRVALHAMDLRRQLVLGRRLDRDELVELRLRGALPRLGAVERGRGAALRRPPFPAPPPCPASRRASRTAARHSGSRPMRRRRSADCRCSFAHSSGVGGSWVRCLFGASRWSSRSPCVMTSAPIVPSRLVISAVNRPKSPAVPATPELFGEFELFDEFELSDELELSASGNGMTSAPPDFRKCMIGAETRAARPSVRNVLMLTSCRSRGRRQAFFGLVARRACLLPEEAMLHLQIERQRSTHSDRGGADGWSCASSARSGCSGRAARI